MSKLTSLPFILIFLADLLLMKSLPVFGSKQTDKVLWMRSSVTAMRAIPVIV
jgi:hypothetical protein